MRMRYSRSVEFLVKLLVKTRLIKYLNFSAGLAVGKKTIRLPIVSGLGYTNLYDYEPWLDNIIKTALREKQGAFVDIGVNIGQTLLKFLQYGDGHEYFGFEPNPSCASYVERLIKANDLKKVSLIPAGLAEKSGILKLYLSDETDGAASLVEGFRPEEWRSESKFVTVLGGDEAVDELGIKTVSLIKIDVEGGELEVIKGLAGTIKKTRPFIICEILPIDEASPERARFRRARAEDLTRILSLMDYKLFRLYHDGRMSPLAGIQTHGNLEWSDHLFMPSEYVGKLDPAAHASRGQ